MSHEDRALSCHRVSTQRGIWTYVQGPVYIYIYIYIDHQTRFQVQAVPNRRVGSQILQLLDVWAGAGGVFTLALKQCVLPNRGFATEKRLHNADPRVTDHTWDSNMCTQMVFGYIPRKGAISTSNLSWKKPQQASRGYCYTSSKPRLRKGIGSPQQGP